MQQQQKGADTVISLIIRLTDMKSNELIKKYAVKGTKAATTYTILVHLTAL